MLFSMFTAHFCAAQTVPKGEIPEKLACLTILAGHQAAPQMSRLNYHPDVAPLKAFVSPAAALGCAA